MHSRWFPLESMVKVLKFGAWTLLASSCFVACGQTAMVAQARSGKYATVRSDLRAHPPSTKQARALARAVLAHEIETAEDKRDRAFIQTIRGCSSGLLPALRSRSKKGDGVSAEAAMVLLELGRLDHPQKYANDPDGAFRALAARASKNDPDKRSRYYLDPDQRVRRAALEAAGEAHDPKDVQALLEVARLDPDPLTRSRAVLAVGKIPDDEASAALRDRFAQMNAALRLSVVDAWGTPPLYEHGGRRQLQRLIAHDTGIETVAAASILAKDENSEVKNPAITRLVRFMDEGTSDEKRLALTTMPIDDALTSRALVKATHANDPNVALIAWSRLLAHERYRGAAEQALLAMARLDDRSLSLQAQSALAAAGSPAIRPELESQLVDRDPAVRKLSALGLIRLGELSRASRLVVDEDREVRRTVACQLSAAPPLSPLR